ncbi:MAG: methyl-accepting chemotaxis protein [Janthinobacterium lividum]
MPRTEPGITTHSSSAIRSIDYRKDFLLPIMTIIMVAAASIIAMLVWLSIQADRREFQTEKSAAAIAVKVHVDSMKQYLADCAAWDDAVRNLVFKLNRQWAAIKIGPYLFKSQGYENSFVINASNETIYASSGSHEAQIDGLRYLGNPLKAAITSIRAMSPEKDRKVAGLTRTADGKVAAFAVAPIVPDTDQVKLPPGGLYLLVLVDTLSAEDAKQIGISHQLQALRLTTPGQIPDLTLRDPSGDVVGGLNWTSRRPGVALRSGAIPVVLIILVCLTLAARRLLGRARVALTNTRKALDDLMASREVVAQQESEARRYLEESVASVKADNKRLNQEAEEVRRLALRDAAIQFGDQIAPIFEVIHGNATALTLAAELVRSRSERLLSSMETAAESVATAEQQSNAVLPEAADFEVCAVSIAAEAKVGLELARVASQHGNQAHSSIKGLAGALSSIDSIVVAIEEVSRETNLLALNATIEAARSGHLGAGFSVVAGEVKSLASRTANLTKTVASQVVAVRASAGVAVSAIEGVAEAVASSERASSTISATAGRQLEGSSKMRAGVEKIARGSAAVSYSIGASQIMVADSRREADDLEVMSKTLNSSLDDLRQAMDRLTRKLLSS